VTALTLDLGDGPVTQQLAAVAGRPRRLAILAHHRHGRALGVRATAVPEVRRTARSDGSSP
jgi:hypothetical protein